jgi:flagellar hook-associated protein 2
MSGLSSASGENFSYSELTNSFTATSTTTGNNSTLTMASADTSGSATNEFLTNAFGYNGDGTTTGTNVDSTGNDGSFNITEPNGTTPTIVSEGSNNFTIDGLNYDVSSNIASATPVTINVASNVAGVVSEVQSFVTAYNNLTSGLNSVTSEKTQSTYPTLTYAQESKMTAAEITSWNDESQQGDLSNDSNLTNLQNAMRSAFSDPVSGSGLNMSSIGLSTSDDPTQGGVLTLNVATLTAALQSNPNTVINLLTQTSTSYPNGPTATTGTAAYSSQNQTQYNEEGIFQRLSGVVTEYAGTMPTGTSGTRGILVNESGLATDPIDTSTLGQSLTDEATSVTNYKTQITTDKAQYTTQYTALQAAMSQLSTEQSEVTSMLGSSSSS